MTKSRVLILLVLLLVAAPFLVGCEGDKTTNVTNVTPTEPVPPQKVTAGGNCGPGFLLFALQCHDASTCVEGNVEVPCGRTDWEISLAEISVDSATGTDVQFDGLKPATTYKIVQTTYATDGQKSPKIYNETTNDAP